MITLQGLTQTFRSVGGIAEASHKFEFGKRYSILGRSGVGKSTLLNLISGLVLPESGKITVEWPSPLRRAFVFQDFPLFPWRTVRENLELPREIHPELSSFESPSNFEAIQKSGLDSWLEHKPSTLSGGMQQRVAILQALMNEPDLLLLDEPFSALDFESKLNMQRLIIEWFYRSTRSMILVTHDIGDAVAMTDIAIVIAGRPGKIREIVHFDFGSEDRDPVKRRRAHQFGGYVDNLMADLQW
jgi:NitT/TauT family transport system ATP-binding protein